MLYSFAVKWKNSPHKYYQVTALVVDRPHLGNKGDKEEKDLLHKSLEARNIRRKILGNSEELGYEG